LSITSIIPLQKPQSKKSELTRVKVKRTFRPSGRTNMLCFSVVMVVNSLQDDLNPRGPDFRHLLHR